MKHIKIRVLNSYDVVIGENILGSLKDLIDFSKYSKLVVITDTNLEKLWLKKLEQSIGEVEEIIIGSGEDHKNIETVQKIWKALLELNVDRKSLVVNLGGGVIGDLGGFAASTYMRGIDFLQIPTTLLAQVDASIGGKVGINFVGVKNLIGSFNQPIGVICDISLLKTLPDREFIEGFGEIIKHGVIADKEYFNFVTSKKPKDFSDEELVEIVKGSCEIKKKIIEEDVTEKDSRRLVNFAHTMGHAIESLSFESDNPLLHGEAVSIGIVIEGKISVIKGILKSQDLEIIVRALENIGLPTKYENLNPTEVLEKVKSDKKSEKGVVYFTLIPEIGRAITGQRISDEEITQALL